MQSRVPRREFLLGMGAAAAATAATSFPTEAVWRAHPLYPPMDLSYFDTPISPAPAAISSIAWRSFPLQVMDAYPNKMVAGAGVIGGAKKEKAIWRGKR